MDYTFLALSSLFVIVDPLAVIPAFVAMTPGDSPAVRARMAKLACFVAAIVLLFFAIAGTSIFRLLGLTLPAFEIAGSLVLLRIALDMLHGRRSEVQETREERAAGTVKDDIAITPLAVPMLAGPGAISTSLLLVGQAADWRQKAALCLSIVVVCTASYFILRLSVRGVQRLSPIALKIVTRLMGLILAAVAVQFMINALMEVGLLRKA